MSEAQPTRPAKEAATPSRPDESLLIATNALMLINVSVCLVQVLGGMPWFDPSPDELLAWGGNGAILTLTGDAWRLVTSIFAHSGPVHLVIVVYMLRLLGSRAQREFGWAGVLLLFLCGGVVASCASAWWQGSHSWGTNVLGNPATRVIVSVGSSGAVMAMAGALWAVHSVRSWYSNSHDVPPDAQLGKALLKVLAINVGMGFMWPGVDNAAHLGGVLAGLALGAPIQFATEFASRWLATATRIILAPLLGIACAWALLHGGDWTQMHELRAARDAKERAEREAMVEGMRAWKLQRAAQRERQSLPSPAPLELARGKVVKFGESGTSLALSTDGKTAYAVDHYGNQVSVIDLQRGTVEKQMAGRAVPLETDCRSMSCGKVPTADIVVLRSQPLALVTSLDSDAVAFIDVAAGQRSKAVRVGKLPHSILLSNDDKRAYVHNLGDNTISVIDVAAASGVGTLRLPRSSIPDELPRHRLPMWLSPDGARLYVATGAPEHLVHEFDVVNMALLGSNEVPYGIEEATKFPGTSGEVLVRSEGAVHTLEGRGKAGASLYLCSVALAPNLAASRLTDMSGYVAVSDYFGHKLGDPIVEVANIRTGVILGRYPIPTRTIKLTLSDDAAHVYVVTNTGDLVILDTRQRLAPEDARSLFCEHQPPRSTLANPFTQRRP